MIPSVYEWAFDGAPCSIRDDDGRCTPLPLGRWLGGRCATAAERGFDRELTSRCAGPTLDLGCGPGRLVLELLERGTAALGVELSPAAVALARLRRAPVLHGDLFGPLPAEGRWRHVILADGNIGIGADPARLLARVARALAVGGTCVVEVEAQVAGVVRGRRRLESGTRIGEWFDWARVGVDGIQEAAAEAGFGFVSAATLSTRTVAEIVRR